MKMHCYFLLNTKHGASQLYWGRPPNTTMRPPGEGPLWGARGASNSLAPALRKNAAKAEPQNVQAEPRKLSNYYRFLDPEKRVPKRYRQILCLGAPKFLTQFYNFGSPSNMCQNLVTIDWATSEIRGGNEKKNISSKTDEPAPISSNNMTCRVPWSRSM